MRMKEAGSPKWEPLGRIDGGRVFFKIDINAFFKFGSTKRFDEVGFAYLSCPMQDQRLASFGFFPFNQIVVSISLHF